MQKFIDGVTELFTGAKARKDAAAASFLAFHRMLVEKLPTPVTKAFGNMGNIPCTNSVTRATANYGITLTVEDHIWWKRMLEEGWTFNAGFDSVKADVIHRLAKITEGQGLNPEERAKLLLLLDDMEATK